MERKWLALTPGDTLPLRLGAKVVPLQDRPVPLVADDGAVRWVGDGPFMGSDYAHEVAPDCRNKTKATIEKNAELAYEELKTQVMRHLMETMEVANHPLFVVNPMHIGVDLARQGGDMTAWTKSWVDDKGCVHVKAIKAEDVYLQKTATEVRLKMDAAGQRIRAMLAE